MTPEHPTPSTSDEHRARLVAAIRALADLIENDPAVPTPDSVHAQLSISGVPTEADLDMIRAVAAHLDVPANIDEETATLRKEIARNTRGQQYFRVDYVIYGNPVGDES
jgi:hypothetical protein